MKQSGNTHRHRAKVASSTRGRLRVKFDRPSRSPAVLDNVKQSLEARAGVGAVSVNAHTGSVTIPYDHALLSRETILRLLGDLDVIVSETVHPTSLDAEEAGSPRASRSLVTAVEDLNMRFHRAVGVPLDLKMLLPLGLAGAGVWSISRQGLAAQSVPGWFLLWLGLDTYVKLHPEHSTKATVSSEGTD